MNITYVLLSPTFGMHQYTADLAGRMANGEWRIANCQPQVRLVTTTALPRDRYSFAVTIHTPVTTHGTGFSREGLDLAAYRRVNAMWNVECGMYNTEANGGKPHSTSDIRPFDRLRAGYSTSSIVHFTGVHAWNLPLVRGLRRRGVPVIHTLHDLDPHTGVRYPALIRLWNQLIIASGCHLLVHGQRTRDQLIARGVPAERVTYTPLLHGFLGAERAWPPGGAGEQGSGGAGERGREDALRDETKSEGGRNAGRKVNVLFFGRIEAYKGVEDLLAAWRDVAQAGSLRYRLIIAGPVARGMALGELPPGVELRDRRIDDAEADALFRNASLFVLPYRDATQSALIAAAYAYGLPVIVTRTGALAEYVVEEETGWIVPPGDPASLAAALTEALADPARLSRMGAAGRAWFVSQRASEGATLAAMYQRLLT